MTDNDGRKPPVVGEEVVDGVTAEDDEAVRIMLTYRSKELDRVHARAEKWTAGLAALVGVLTTAVVIKGPDSFTKLDDVKLCGHEVAGAHVVIGLMVAGGIALAFGIFFAYEAANGNPFQDSAVDAAASTDGLSIGAAQRWRDAVRTTILDSKTNLKRATQVTIVAAILLAAAILATWLIPQKSSADETFCARVGTSTDTVKFDGHPPPVTSGSLTLVPCVDE